MPLLSQNSLNEKGPGFGKTVFLDRDGVINRDSKDYIKSPDEFLFLENSPGAIARLNKAGFKVIVITNQSAVARGFITTQTLDSIHEKMKRGVSKAGGEIKDIFYCPHWPHKGCKCRKPMPGLIQMACEKYGIDPGASLMVGDKITDIQCGQRAGCKYSILVKSGVGRCCIPKGVNPDLISEDLFRATDWIISRF